MKLFRNGQSAGRMAAWLLALSLGFAGLGTSTMAQSITGDGGGAGVGGGGAADIGGGGGGGGTPSAATAAAPPPPPPPQDMALYVSVEGQVFGPFTRAEVEEFIRVGQLTGQTVVWMEGMAEWLPAARVEPIARMIDGGRGGGGGGGGGGSDVDAARFMVGTWATENAMVPVPNVGLGKLSAQITYTADGRMQLSGTLTFVAQGREIVITMKAEGTYTLQVQPDGTILIQPQGQMVMSAPGFPSQTEMLTETISITVVDQNTIRDGEGTISRRVG